MQEPHGHKDMYGVFLAPPTTAEFDAGTIWMNGLNFMHTCGHGTIGLSIAMIETGLKARKGDLTTLHFETTAGLVTSVVKAGSSGAEWCRYQNVPTFIEDEGIHISLAGHGEVRADIVFCGNYFGVIDWRQSDLKICPENASKFSSLGLEAHQLLNEKIQVCHPLYPHINRIETITFHHEPTAKNAHYRSSHVFGQGQLDRSLGGAATAAILALLEHRGEIALGDIIHAEGLLGMGTFEGSLIGETDIEGRRAVVPTIKGTARVTGSARWEIDPDDEIGLGFIVN